MNCGGVRVVQLSAGYGLWRYRPGPIILKARLWFLNDVPMDGLASAALVQSSERDGLRRAMDGAVATANQPVYTAAPLFDGLVDPVPVRLAMLYGEQTPPQFDSQCRSGLFMPLVPQDLAPQAS